MINVLHLDINHSILIEGLEVLGCKNTIDTKSSKSQIEKLISGYEGLIIRSRFPIDEHFLNAASNLKFIARVGAGLENIDTKYAYQKDIKLISAPEGNANAVGEHTLGMLLSLLNNFRRSDAQIRDFRWLREENRGEELDGKTIGIIGYGNMGKAFAKKLKGFDVKVLCYDIKSDVEDENATQVSLEVLQDKSEILSLHVPQTELTKGMMDSYFINKFRKNFWLINTARGSCVKTDCLVQALKNQKIKGAALDVLEYEKSSFENLKNINLPESFRYLIGTDNVILTPHIAGWSYQSSKKMAQIIVDKIKANFFVC